MKSYVFILLVWLAFSCTSVQQEKDFTETLPFSEKHRPQYHFTPTSQWMNDPNGMVYYEGEYHLFYQYYPDSNVWGPMHWGHAVSTDMIKWEHLPIALYPDSLGFIFSGSAVIDWKNTSGLGEANNPAMVAIYTYHDPVMEEEGSDLFQTQGIAYSLDKGRTWTKYADNPVIPNPGIRDFRDPKVSWHAPSQKWIMILAVMDHVSIYSSPNLTDWTFESDFGPEWAAYGGVWECPDLFPLIDKSGDQKWVMLLSINPGGPQGGSATQYFIGDFDGSSFTPSQEHIAWLDYGADNYAGVTWSDVPEKDGRRLFIGWMSNWQYANIVPTTAWRSAMTIPRSLVLKGTAGNHLLISEPVAEINNIANDFQIIAENEFEMNIDQYHLVVNQMEIPFEVTLANNQGEQVVVIISDEILSINRAKSGITDFHEAFAAKHSAPVSQAVSRLDIFMDASSIEVFVNNGEIVMTDLIFPNEPLTSIKWDGEVKEVKVRTIQSIFQSKIKSN